MEVQSSQLEMHHLLQQQVESGALTMAPRVLHSQTQANLRLGETALAALAVAGETVPLQVLRPGHLVEGV
jgi:hypothetical protein